MLILNASIILCYGVLTLALASLWLPRFTRCGTLMQWLWLGLLLIAIALGLVFGFLKTVALLPFALFTLFAFVLYRKNSGQRLRLISAVGVVALALAMTLHQVPGINNPQVFVHWRLTPNALPYDKFFNFDSALIGLCLVGFGHRRLAGTKEWLLMLRRVVPVTLTTLATVMLLSLLLGYVEWQPKWTPLFFTWAWGNLFFTCIVEEAFFRGLILKELARLMQCFKGGTWIALLVASFLFGLAHFAGGVKYVLLASVAGIGYGGAYLYTQRLEAAILTHFALNALHFLLFTYPALAAA